VLPSASAARTGTNVHVHVGAAHVPARLVVLEVASKTDSTDDAVAPGAKGLVQLILHHPVSAWHGDRFIMRDASATRTVAGGRVGAGARSFRTCALPALSGSLCRAGRARGPPPASSTRAPTRAGDRRRRPRSLRVRQQRAGSRGAGKRVASTQDHERRGRFS